jgi:hypothetical protein
MDKPLNLFSEDYSHFEENHIAFPVEAQAVLQSIADLRTVLNEFRRATENKCVVDDDAAIASVIPAEEEIASTVILPEAMARASLDAVEESVLSDVSTEAALDSPTGVVEG